MNYYRVMIIAVTMLMGVAGCSTREGKPMEQDESSIEVGGLYARQDGEGSWRVVKVLAVEEGIVHLRSYANKFSEQPKDLDPATLTMGGIDDPAGFGIGHFPLATDGFFNEKPILLKVVPVNEDELEGYKLYLDAMKEGG